MSNVAAYTVNETNPSKMSTPAPTCPTDEYVLLYVEGSLPTAEEDEVRAHLLGCDGCRDLVVAITRDPKTSAGSRAGSRGSSSSPRREPEVILGGKYVVEYEIARGGMGRVVAARHVKLGRRVAIKTIHKALVGDPDVLRRFDREARAVASLHSKHVVRVLDIETTDDGEPFIVMELLHGADLGALVKRNGPLPVKDAVRYALDACDALTEAHAAGIVHRDIKPGNIFLTESDAEPVLKVLDFGLAKALPGASYEGADHTAASLSGSIVGSPPFMSPEQIQGFPVDARTDVWSLGATLHHLLYGQAPFGSGDVLALRARILKGERVRVSSPRADVSPELEAVIAQCLLPVGERLQSIALLGGALTAVRFETTAPMAVASLSTPPPATSPAPASPAIADATTFDDAMTIAKPAIVTNTPPPLLHEEPARAPLRTGLWPLFAALFVGLAVALVYYARMQQAPPAIAPVTSAQIALTPSPPVPVSPDMIELTDPPALATGGTVPGVRPAGSSARKRAPVAASSSAAPPSSASSAASCDPPYVVDANGIKRYRRSCFSPGAMPDPQ